ncbi:hypothetical protein AURDEDRAFT_166226 [Auricularia subglabra TFB-10046 SS5]|nr:hypothetical protein AURDEDRAFT_166226 [Auricularia subglabra TFB-10046 SS5]
MPVRCHCPPPPASPHTHTLFDSRLWPCDMQPRQGDQTLVNEDPEPEDTAIEPAPLSEALEERFQRLEAMVNNSGRKRQKRPATTTAWYKKRTGQTPEEKISLQCLVTLSRNKLRAFLGIFNNSDKLPDSGTQVQLSTDTPGFCVNLRSTASHKTPENTAWITRACQALIVDCKEPSTAGFLSSVPAITADAIQHAVSLQFTYLKRKYKEQTDCVTAQKRTQDEHAGRWKSTPRVKWEHRSKGVERFEAEHGFNPSDMLKPDYMSGDESAGDNEGLDARYLELMKLTDAKAQLPDLRLLAPQILEWRSPNVDKVYIELNQIAESLRQSHKKKRGHKALPRVTRDLAAGRIVSSPPALQPLPCMLQDGWRESAADTYADILAAWDATPEVDPEVSIVNC